MNMTEIMKKLIRSNPARYGPRNITSDNLAETIDYYNKLSVVYKDADGNVILL